VRNVGFKQKSKIYIELFITAYSALSDGCLKKID
jgi:hypothetical protein